MPEPIRDVRQGDLTAVLELNEAVVPAVNSISLSQMGWFRDNAFYFRVVSGEAGSVSAFLIGLRPGIAYESLNYRWFSKRYEDFGYIDRVAVADSARRSGLASRLYADFATTLSGSVDTMTCEVNLRPPNPGSMRFHEQFGFREVGRQETEAGAKEVALLAKTIQR